MWGKKTQQQYFTHLLLPNGSERKSNMTVTNTYSIFLPFLYELK